MAGDEVGSSSEWSFEQDKAFENALGTYPEDDPDRWEKIAADVTGKTLEEVKQHYKLLVDDVNLIESGRVTLSAYNSTSEGSTGNASDKGAGKKGGQPWNSNSESNNGSKASRSDQDGVRVLLGQKMNTGYFFLDWRSMERVTGEVYREILW